MTRLRARVAERLKGAQNTYAMLTTFNEIDMTNLMKLRSDYKVWLLETSVPTEQPKNRMRSHACLSGSWRPVITHRHALCSQDLFLETHGVKLGFMSAFVKASADALLKVPAVNGVIDGDEIIYRDYTDISIAVATPKGLVVPVLRNVDSLSFAEVEKVSSTLHDALCMYLLPPAGQHTCLFLLQLQPSSAHPLNAACGIPSLMHGLSSAHQSLLTCSLLDLRTGG